MNVTRPYWWLVNIRQVMAWCRQQTSHYLSQCWPRSLMPYGVYRPQWVKARQNGLHFADDICKRIFSNENVCISVKISVNMFAMFQIMAWRLLGTKPIMAYFTDTYMRHSAQWVKRSSVVDVDNLMRSKNSVSLPVMLNYPRWSLFS